MRRQNARKRHQMRSLRVARQRRDAHLDELIDKMHGMVRKAETLMRSLGLES